ncbi:hypothetical protein [Klebsiella pneumoniae]|uniref:hypothetical protein n=1 Tax=Klebsiella pneumoniae TaxID=573 RepID=UPI003F57E037
MSNEDEFFAEMHPQIAQVIGIAVMQLLVEKREPSREALIEMIQVLWQGDQVDLAVKWSTKTGHRVRVFPVSVF